MEDPWFQGFFFGVSHAFTTRSPQLVHWGRHPCQWFLVWTPIFKTRTLERVPSLYQRIDYFVTEWALSFSSKIFLFSF
jgi:hypothetical protein